MGTRTSGGVGGAGLTPAPTRFRDEAALPSPGSAEGPPGTYAPLIAWSHLANRSRQGNDNLLHEQRRKLPWPMTSSNQVSHRQERQAPGLRLRTLRLASRRLPVSRGPYLPVHGASLRSNPRSSRSPAIRSSRSPVGVSPHRLRSPAGVSRSPVGVSRSRAIRSSRSPVGVSPHRLRSPVGVSPRSSRSPRSPLSPRSSRSPRSRSPLSPLSPLGVSRLHSNRPGASPRRHRSNRPGASPASNPAIRPPDTGCPATAWVRQVPGSPCKACL
jgi:hypothetical protein